MHEKKRHSRLFHCMFFTWLERQLELHIVLYADLIAPSLVRVAHHSYPTNFGFLPKSDNNPNKNLCCHPWCKHRYKGFLYFQLTSFTSLFQNAMTLFIFFTGTARTWVISTHFDSIRLRWRLFRLLTCSGECSVIIRMLILHIF